MLVWIYFLQFRWWIICLFNIMCVFYIYWISGNLRVLRISFNRFGPMCSCAVFDEKRSYYWFAVMDTKGWYVLVNTVGVACIYIQHLYTPLFWLKYITYLCIVPIFISCFLIFLTSFLTSWLNRFVSNVNFVSDPWGSSLM